MPLELMREHILMRADAGVLEIFVLGSAESRRIPLRWLLVRGSNSQDPRMKIFQAASGWSWPSGRHVRALGSQANTA
jgi:hypothetical protein